MSECLAGHVQPLTAVGKYLVQVRLRYINSFLTTPKELKVGQNTDNLRVLHALRTNLKQRHESYVSIHLVNPRTFHSIFFTLLSLKVNIFTHDNSSKCARLMINSQTIDT